MLVLLNNKEWLDEYPELIKKFPQEMERVASFEFLCMTDTPFRWLLSIIGSIPLILFISGRGGPMIDLGIGGMIGSVVFALLMMAWMGLLGRHEKGHIDIYPEMMIFYDYDPYTKKARPSQFYYWTDIVQYHWEGSYLWIGAKDSEPVSARVGICELRPYLEQYAPHAEVVRFNMDRYFEEREKKQSGQDEEK